MYDTRQTDRAMREPATASGCFHGAYAGKQSWIDHYSRRMLRLWSNWETDLGVAHAYVRRIRSDLADFYGDPLKRMFIEATY